MIRAALMSLTLLTLTACGFTPLHQSAPGQTTFSNLRLTMTDGRDEGDRAAGFMIEQRLRDRLSVSGPSKYQVFVEPRVQRVGLGLTGLDRATRYDSIMSADWTLRDVKTGKVIARGNTRQTATFSADRDPYRLLSTDVAAQERVARIVADQLLVDLALAVSEADAP